MVDQGKENRGSRRLLRVQRKASGVGRQTLPESSLASALPDCWALSILGSPFLLHSSLLPYCYCTSIPMLADQT